MVGNRVQITMAKARCDEALLGITAQVPEMTASLPKVRKEKILTVRRQLAEDKYPIKEQLNVALDRLLEYLIIERVQENEEKSTTLHQQK